jgi:hypothetical protein
VRVPDLLGRHDEVPGRGGALSPLGPGSPVRYYAAAMPATTPAVLAAAACGWDRRESRSWLATAAACSIAGSAASVYLVRAVNLRLFFGDQPLGADERDRLLRTWYRVNAARIAVAGGTLLAAHKARTRLLQ